MSMDAECKFCGLEIVAHEVRLSGEKKAETRPGNFASHRSRSSAPSTSSADQAVNRFSTMHTA